MSKQGNNASMKQETSPFRKDNRGSQSQGNKDGDKRNSGFTGQHNRSGQGNRQNQQNNQRQSDNNKDNSEAKSENQGEKKFTGRCRLFVGNLTPDVTENEFKKMFEPFGETSEAYVSQGRGFGFIRLDYRHNAEAAKAALDGTQKKGRFLRVRFATHGAALKVRHLHPYVSNELLEQSFSQFGDLERCVVIVDDKGKPTGEGIVEFARKPGANSALRRIKDGVFLVGADPKPVAVEPLEQRDEEDGMPEKFLTKTEQYKKEREKEPRFAPPGTFEYEFGMRWKQIEEMEKQRIEQVKKDTEEARIKLEDEMQNALYEYQAEQIRQDLIRQQEELRRLEELRNADRLRRQEQLDMRRQQDDRERLQAEERRRADMMMSMRQQEIARGRGGGMDSNAMRNREDMMMAERYGDRMGDRMGERIPDRMMDRMPERMGDRMGDRMPERMGSQGAGFMWDEKARAEGAMRGDGGRGPMGRDMRGGAPPLQPPPVPPSGMNNMERGGGPGPQPNQPAPPANAQGGPKSSPKPLMQANAFNQQGGAGGPGGPGVPNPNAGQDMNQMAETPPASPYGESGEPPGSETLHTLEATQSKEKIEDGPASVEGDAPVCVSADAAISSRASCPQSPGDQQMESIEQQDEELWKTDTDYRTPSSTEVSPSKVSICSRNSSFSKESPIVPCPEFGDQDIDYRLPSPAKENDIPSLRCRSEEKLKTSLDSSKDTPNLPKPPNGCRAKSLDHHGIEDLSDNEMPRSTSLKNYQQDAVSEKYNTSNNDREFEVGSEQSDKLQHSETCDRFEASCSKKDVYTNMKVGDDQYFSSEKVSECSDSEVCDEYTTSSLMPKGYTDGAYQTLATDSVPSSEESLSKEEIHYSPSRGCQSKEPIQRYLSAEGRCTSTKNPEEYQSSEHSVKNCDEDSPTSNGIDSYIFTHPHKLCNTSDTSAALDNASNPQYVTSNTHIDENSFSQNVEHYKSCDGADNEVLSTVDNYAGGLSQIEAKDQEESVNLSETSGPVKRRRHSSYKQDSLEDTEDLEGFEIMDEGGEVAANVYQSYEEGSIASSYQTMTALHPNFGPQQMLPGCWPVVDTTPCTSSFNSMVEETTTSDSQIPASVPCTVPAETPTIATDPSDNGNDGALRTGDQSFKTASARQSALVPFMQPGQSSSHPASVYGGSAIYQGLGHPGMMTSSSMHMGGSGATLLRHQTLSSGPHHHHQATVVQQLASTGGGQTMLVQQRTLTTGQGSVAQQTVVQQRMTTGGGMAQQTMMQQRMAPGNRVAQQTMLHQHMAPRMPQVIRPGTMIHPTAAVRLAQARVMGAPLVRGRKMTGGVFVAGSRGPSLLRRGQASMMQQLVRQRYLGGPMMPGRGGIHMVAGHPLRMKMTYTRESMSMESNP